MPSEPCSISKNCVWRAADRLTASGRPTKPTDLCIAMTLAIEPCGRRAERFLSPNEDAPTQPLCDAHYRQIVEAVMRVSGITHAVYKATEPLERRIDLLTKNQSKLARERAPREQVYFARRDDIVKIGFSSAVKRRLRNIETAGGFVFDEVVSCSGGHRLELQYHERFAADRFYAEWFNMSPAIRKEMNRLQVAMAS